MEGEPPHLRGALGRVGFEELPSVFERAVGASELLKGRAVECPRGERGEGWAGVSERRGTVRAAGESASEHIEKSMWGGQEEGVEREGLEEARRE